MRTTFFRAIQASFAFLLFYGSVDAALEKEVSSEEILTIDSDLASYEEKQCLLTGHVTVEHQLGVLSANQAILTPEKNGNKHKLGNLHILGDVVFNLKEGGELQCAKAEIDCQSLEGIFFSDALNPYVIYTETVQNGSTRDKVLTVKGRQMKMAVDHRDEPKLAGSSSNSIREIFVDHDVVLNYEGSFVARGDRGFYNRHLVKDPQLVVPPIFSGTVTLDCTAPERLCIVETCRGDLIKAEKIEMDTTSKQLSFSFPKGSLTISEKDHAPIHFAADKSIWNEDTHALTLQGNIEISQWRLGTLYAQNEVRILQHVENGEKKLSSVQAEGKAIMSYSNEDKNLDYSLTCYGSIKIDHLKMEAWLFSPKNAEGVVEHQIHLDDIKGEIFADKAFIKYEIRDKEIVPAKIILGGNVRILNTLTRHENGTTTALQYALADQVEYVPHSGEMFFKSNSNRRVLFFDKANNLQVSAPALKIIRGKEAHKETVQGYGDVRFSFIEHEFEMLRKRFAFDKSNPILPIK